MNIGAGIGIGFAEPRGVLAFEYEQSSGCENGSDITPVINTPGGTFSSSPAGLSINSSTGVIDVSASTTGTYTVTYSIGPTEDTITIEAADDAAFTYSASSFPQDGSNPIPTITGLAGGTFSAGSGLVFVDSGSNTGSSTGQINLSASTIASYTVTYTTSGSCPNTSTQTVEVASALAMSYSSSAFCEDASDPTPTVTGNVGAGTFSSTTGLVFVSTTTGEVDLSASTPSATPYVITYTDTNAATATFNLTINALDNATFSYSDSSYAQSFPDPTPTITGLVGGTFSGSTGLVINSTTGEIDLDASTIAAHTITYDTTSSGSSVCANTSTQTVNVVAALLQLDNAYSMDFDGTNDSINIDGALTTLSSTTVGSWSYWVKTTNATLSSPQRMIQFGDTNGNGFLYIRIETDGKIGSQARNSNVSDWSFKSDSSIFSNNTWTHIAVVQDGVQPKVYKNGVEVPITFTTSTDKAAWFSDLPSLDNGRIGCGNQNNAGDIQFFNGAIDEVSFFNTALTEFEVQSIYYATETGKTADLNDLTTPPVKWYRMGD